ncbi:alpha/beta hydrolase [Cnuibacter physcomitrellae]|uniref:alpha/beta hydrolase n=1 Tax=Cnuibacter physcomitrellae TaxID=1619308 RepID=UPI0021760D78|nr:alpha/beta hydrolase [Cnuibacter physcomitrellae]MCS5497583.1 alpha/beta hydrolase [Cnuibacter physcomitrellae]
MQRVRARAPRVRRALERLADLGRPRRVPVWMWRGLMRALRRSELARFNADPVTDVDYHLDLDFVGDGIRAHRLDVITPKSARAAEEPLPVYVYFHGGGWTSGDKDALTKYCACQARHGMVVVNVNYRRATRFRMTHIMHDADAALAWVRGHIADYGGDPDRLVLGGDSAGGQISALLTASAHHRTLAGHYRLRAAPLAGAAGAIRGLVQHCSVVDFSVLFERGFIMGLGFVRMLLPGGARSATRSQLQRASTPLSPIEWVDRSFPPVFVSTSERDYFYRANLNFIARLRDHGVRVRSLVYDRSTPNTLHTWQQFDGYPQSQEVYRRLREFVHEVTHVGARPAPGTAALGTAALGTAAPVH